MFRAFAVCVHSAHECRAPQQCGLFWMQEIFVPDSQHRWIGRLSRRELPWQKPWHTGLCLFAPLLALAMLSQSHPVLAEQRYGDSSVFTLDTRMQAGLG